jgi:hypothetical protein
MEELKIFRSRQPVTDQSGRIGYLDFWTKDRERALINKSQSPDRVFESISFGDIARLPPGSMMKALAAWNEAYPDYSVRNEEL